MRPEAPDVGVVFVNYHCAASIARRAAPLVEAGLQVVVVDNSGEYGGPGVVASLGHNVGFGSACNEGVRHLPPSCRTVCFHNPDVDAGLDSLLALASRLGRSDRPGAVVPVLRTPDGLVNRGYHAPQLARELGIAVRRVRRRRQSTLGGPSRGGSRRPPSTPGFRFGSGALVLVSRDAFDHVGGFDARYPLYAEDLDLWRRLHDAGFEMIFDDDVVVEHDKASGSPVSTATRARLRDAGVELFVQLYHGGVWRLYRAVHRLTARSSRSGHRQPIDSLIDAAWARSDPPAAVAARIRAAFASGAMNPSKVCGSWQSDCDAVGGLLVTHEPDLDHLQLLIERVTSTGIRLVVADNGSSVPEDVVRAAKAAGASGVRHAGNVGVAQRLNESLRHDPDAEWLLYLDQDSRVEMWQLEELLEAARSAPAHVAIISPQYRQVGTGHLGYGARHIRRLVRSPIGSGTLYRVSACVELGGFDPALPLDLADLEMCLRLQRERYAVDIVDSVVVEHTVGGRRSSSGVRLAAGERHEPWRYYLKWRGLSIITRRYFTTFPGWVARHVLGRSVETLRSALALREGAIVEESVRGLLGLRSTRVPKDLFVRARPPSSVPIGHPCQPM